VGGCGKWGLRKNDEGGLPTRIQSQGVRGRAIRLSGVAPVGEDVRGGPIVATSVEAGGHLRGGRGLYRSQTLAPHVALVQFCQANSDALVCT